MKTSKLKGFRRIGGALSGYDNGTKDVLERVHEQQSGRIRRAARLSPVAIIVLFPIGLLLGLAIITMLSLLFSTVF